MVIFKFIQMKTKATILIMFFLWINMFSQHKEEINWKNWQELEEAYEEEPKPVFIFFHAEWCAYCKKIEREIFTNKEVINQLNKNYYAVEMDAETQDTIVFDNATFTNKQALTKRNGVHELPLLLASRKNIPFSLPATLIFDKSFSLKKRIFEYYTSKQLIEML